MQLKNKTYLFGRVSPEYLEIDTDAEGLFQYEEKFYYFKITVDEDEVVRIYDTCDRMVPIGFENLCEIRDTLNKIIGDVATAAVGADYAVS